MQYLSSHQHLVKCKVELEGVAAQEDHNYCNEDQSKVGLPPLPQSVVHSEV